MPVSRQAGRRHALALGLAALAAAFPDSAGAQERPRPAVEFAAGWIGFADDGIVNEAMIGGAVRWYVSPQVSLGPEGIYIAGDRHSHLVVTGNVTYDILAAANGRSRRVTPFLVAGGGLFRTRETFVTGDFTSHEGAFTAGGGLRGFVSDRIMAGVDARVGWELHIRVNGFVGVQLGG